MRRLIPVRPDWTYEALRRAFSWSVPDELNMGVACTRHPADDVALIVDAAERAPQTLTFGQLADKAARLAGGLAGRGVGAGDRVGIVVPQSLETGLAHLATWWIGGISVPMAALFGPDALAFRIADSGAAVVVADRANAPKVREAAPDTPLVVVESDFPALLASAPVDPAPTMAEDPALLIYTSGTTGPPKGALHAHRSLYGHLPAFELFYEFAPQPGDRIWTPADWAWIGALMDVVVPAWFHGIPVLTTSRDFDPHAAVALMAAHHVSLAFLPPTALKMMRAADAGHPDLALRAIFTGGEPLGAELLGWAQDRLGAIVNEGYGQTECNLVVGNCASVWPVRPGSMGRAVPGHDVVVLNDNGQRVVRAVGEVCIRSPDPVMMLEYWKNPEATAAKYRDGWLRTGDLAIEDADGYLWFQSRVDDIISSRGYRIGPGEIEDCLLGHPAVAMCAVVGVPDDLRGEVPAAFVVLRDGLDPGPTLASELQAQVRTRLGAHEVPQRISFVDDLPRTTTGKVLRRVLRDR